MTVLKSRIAGCRRGAPTCAPTAYPSACVKWAKDALGYARPRSHEVCLGNMMLKRTVALPLA